MQITPVDLGTFAILLAVLGTGVTVAVSGRLVRNIGIEEGREEFDRCQKPYVEWDHVRGAHRATLSALGLTAFGRTPDAALDHLREAYAHLGARRRRQDQDMMKRVRSWR